MAALVAYLDKNLNYSSVTSEMEAETLIEHH